MATDRKPVRVLHADPELAAKLGDQARSMAVHHGVRRDDGAWILHGEPPAELGAPGAEAPIAASVDPRARLRRDGFEAG
jgi:hypothetical protein